MKKYIIITAGGKGSRMGANIPKQYIKILDKPILFHTIDRIHNIDSTYNLITVINNCDRSTFCRLKSQYIPDIPVTVVTGGDTRFQSVKNAVFSIEDDEALVAIHDGVRPFITKKMLLDSFLCAEQKGNAVCAVRPMDSVRFSSDNKNSSVNRDNIFLIQTPQTFKLSCLKKAYNQEYNPLFTDDASVAESVCGHINLIEGSPYNIKITLPSDIIIAEQFLKQMNYDK